MSTNGSVSVAAIQRCESCGREGTRGFRTIPAGTLNGFAYPTLTECAGKTACRRRAYRLTPPHVRAPRRVSDEIAWA